MVVPSLICAAVLLWSGIAKLLHRESALTTLRGLDLPQGILFRYAAASIPIAELVIAVSWVVLPAPFSLVPVGLGTMLFLAFTLVVIRARTRRSDAECMCFGSRKSIDGTTIARNGALVLVSSAAMIGAATQDADRMAGVLETVITNRDLPKLVTGILIVGSWMLLFWGIEHVGVGAQSSGRGSRPIQNSGGTLTIQRADGAEVHVPNPTPHVAFVKPSGRFIGIDDVASPHGVLLLMLSPTCSLCEIVRQRLDDYRDAIAPVRVAVVGAVESGGGLLDGADLGDLYGMASEMLGANTYPAALIALPNGTIPVGPVFGPDAIDELVTALSSDLRAARARQ